jgi:hypothetical protein
MSTKAKIISDREIEVFGAGISGLKTSISLINNN